MIEVWDKIGDSSIVSHNRNGDLVTVGYSNGTIVYINYAKNEQIAEDGVAVAPLSYRIAG